MNKEIIIHEKQSEIYDFLKIDNKNCLNCTENIENVCNSITSEFYNNQDKIKKDKIEDKKGLFDE